MNFRSEADSIVKARIGFVWFATILFIVLSPLFLFLLLIIQFIPLFGQVFLVGTIISFFPLVTKKIGYFRGILKKDLFMHSNMSFVVYSADSVNLYGLPSHKVMHHDIVSVLSARQIFGWEHTIYYRENGVMCFLRTQSIYSLTLPKQIVLPGRYPKCDMYALYHLRNFSVRVVPQIEGVHVPRSTEKPDYEVGGGMFVMNVPTRELGSAVSGLERVADLDLSKHYLLPYSYYGTMPFCKLRSFVDFVEFEAMGSCFRIPKRDIEDIRITKATLGDNVEFIHSNPHLPTRVLFYGNVDKGKILG